MLKVDLGCGPNKPVGFVGIDRFCMPGVDIVADLNKQLPLASDTVDLLYASHSLEHVNDLMFTVREIFRVCKHGAQVCIVAPYYEQKLNLANPYHISAFNEHTPRFWTDYPEAPLETSEFIHPHASSWGLSRSDHSDPGVDLRLARMEFFYFPEYRDLSPKQQRELRQQRFDVCDQIMYHLIVWKSEHDLANATYSAHLSAFEPFEPNYIKERKAKEFEEHLSEYSNERPLCPPRQLNAQSATTGNATVSIPFERIEDASQFPFAEAWLQDLRSQNNHLNVQLAAMLEKFLLAQNQMHDTKIDLARTQEELAVQGDTLAAVRKENQELRSQHETAEAIRAKSIALNAQLELTNHLLERYRAAEVRWKIEEKALEAELVAAKQANSSRGLSSRIQFFKSVLSHTNPLWKSVSPAFSSLKSYTEEFIANPRDARLELSGDLRKVPYREYLITGLTVPTSSLSFAISSSTPASNGQVGVEIVSASQQILVQVIIPLRNVDPNSPTVFALTTPIGEVGPKWGLRIFVRDADVPVAVYEMVSYRLFGRVKRLPFAVFE